MIFEFFSQTLAATNPVRNRRAPLLFVLWLVGSLAAGRAVDTGAGPAKADEQGSSSAVYVDCWTGQDGNPGTKDAPLRSIARAAQIIRSRDNGIFVVKLNPGIHVLQKHVALATEKDMAGHRIVIEASVLPDDPAWTPDQMPVVVNACPVGDAVPNAPNNFVSFLVEANDVVLRGLKFQGHARPNSYYFPIARFNKTKSDLQVEQCLFIGDRQAAHIQVAVIGHGNGIKINHCIFYHVNNAVVFWEDAGDKVKSGNEFTNSIIVGAGESAVWTSWPDQDFVFRNNIVAQCRRVWVKNAANTAAYRMQDCVTVENQLQTTVCYDDGVRPESFNLTEINVVRSGEIRLRFSEDLDHPLPRDYLHPVPGSLGSALKAGLFKE